MYLELDDINKSFGKEDILHELHLEIKKNETLSVLGPSGSGKTTLLKIIAGLISADNGKILLNGTDISMLPANKRNIVYLNQEPLLFPHLNVAANIAFGLQLRKIPAEKIKVQVNHLIETLGLREQKKKFPDQLSGGQRQRVAFGRAIIINPPLLMLDEPFASLDAETRTSMQQFLKHVTKEFSITSIFVTHDLKEAILMADRLAYLNNGTLKSFKNVSDFISDATTGVQKEVMFWKSLPLKGSGQE